MRDVKFYEATGIVKLIPESFEDLYLLAIIISLSTYGIYNT